MRTNKKRFNCGASNDVPECASSMVASSYGILETMWLLISICMCIHTRGKSMKVILGIIFAPLVAIAGIRMALDINKSGRRHRKRR